MRGFKVFLQETFGPRVLRNIIEFAEVCNATLTQQTDHVTKFSKLEMVGHQNHTFTSQKVSHAVFKKMSCHMCIDG